MAAPDSDEEDSYVEIGTALEVPDEDEPRRKKIHVEDLPVKDSHGRTRFHGAFTGGFSAGYFNTAGSKEGWTPSTFSSSRSQRAEKSRFRPEDYMDTDDLGEHGIAPRKFTATASFVHQRALGKRGLVSEAELDVLSTGSFLTDLILPDVPPMGIRLLRKMGWKDGQGVGPRRKKKHKQKAAVNKVYGCSLHPNDSDSEISEEEAEYLKNFTFAPKDVTPVDFTPKDNYHGIGYSGLNPKAALQSTRFNLFETEAKVTKKGKRGIKGQAFGVGALEEDDDDVYGVDSFSNYHQTLSAPGEEEGDQLFGWTAPKGKQLALAGQGVSGINGGLQGFSLSSSQLAPSKVFQSPRIPHNYRPYHIEMAAVTMQTAPEKGSLNFITRGLLLGEKPSIAALANLKKPDPVTSNKTISPVVKIPPVPSVSDDGKSAESEAASTTTTTTPSIKPFQINQSDQSRAGPPVYKPFDQDPAKQQRYEQYMVNLKQNKNDAYNGVTSTDLTEWEIDKEKEEFSRASHLYKPLSFLMASRFTTAKFSDNTENVTMPTKPKSEKSDADKAAEMKMFGKLTREVLEWHPDNTLCKRFNVPNPYPGSQIVGLPGSKRNRYSVFNFLDVSMETPTQPASDDASNSLAIKSKENAESASKTMTAKKPRPKITTANIFTAYFEEEDRKVKGRDWKGVETPTEKVAKEKVTEAANVEPKQTTESERPPMDLFKAIFQDSDSESSENEAMDVNIAMEAEVSKTSKQIEIIPAASLQRNMTEMAMESTSGSIRTETLAERLSPPGEEMFGPSLPPAYNPSSQTSGNQVIGQESSVEGHLFVERSSSSQRIEKHKGKDRGKEKNKERKKDKSRHKHKKKKAKQKKGKHKKEKKERRRHSSGYDASTSESEEFNEGPGDQKILKKLKQVTGKGRLKASDFM